MHTSLWSRLALVAILPLGACTAAAPGDPGLAPSDGGVAMDALPDVPAPDAPPAVDAGTDAAPSTDTARTDTGPRTDTGQPTPAGRLGSACSTLGGEPESQGDCADGLFCHEGAGFPGGLCTLPCEQDSECATALGGPGSCVLVGSSRLCLQRCTPGSTGACRRTGYVCGPTAQPTIGACVGRCNATPSLSCPAGTACNAATSLCEGTQGFYQPCDGSYGACARGGVCSTVRGASTQAQCFADCTAGNACPTSPPGARCLLMSTDGTRTCAIPCTPGNDAPCPTGTTCAAVTGGGVCVIRCTAGEACVPPSGACRVGRAVCSPGASCVDTGATAPDGTACGTGRVCSDGSCVACRAGTACTPTDPCRTGSIACTTGREVCVDRGAATDGTACGAGRVCAGGTCLTCSPGATCAPANPCHRGRTTCTASGVGCTDIGGNLADGTACGTAMVCRAGACTACAASTSCAPASAPCHVGSISCSTGAPVCMDTGANAPNGTACGTGQACTAGVCACASGFTMCSGRCVDLQSDATSCGFCGIACTAGRVCSRGACGCPAGRTDCSGTCRDTQTDLTACGACGRSCPSFSTCVAGTCVCAPGRTFCAGGCFDLRGSDGNCGACGTACGTGRTCFNSMCQPLVADHQVRGSVVALPDGRILDVAAGANRVVAYTPSTNTWAALTTIPGASTSHVAVTGVDGRVYVFGSTGAVDIYNPTANTWSAGTATTAVRRDNALVAVIPDGRIYVMGGGSYCSTGGPSSVVQVYIPTTNSWGVAAPVPRGVASTAAVTGPDGKIYIFGAVTPGGICGVGVAPTWIYDPAMNSWTTGPSLPNSAAFLGAARGADGYIYLFGGQHYSSGSAYAAVYRYDVVARTYLPRTDIPNRSTIYGGPAVFAANGNFYFFDRGNYNVQAYSGPLDLWWR